MTIFTVLVVCVVLGRGASGQTRHRLAVRGRAGNNQHRLRLEKGKRGSPQQPQLTSEEYCRRGQYRELYWDLWVIMDCWRCGHNTLLPHAQAREEKNTADLSWCWLSCCKIKRIGDYNHTQGPSAQLRL